MKCSSPSFEGSSPRSRACSSVSSASRGRGRMATIATLCFAAQGIAFASGCVRAVLVPETSPVRLAETVKAKVWILEDGIWIESVNEVELKEGLYIVPPSYVHE